MCEQWLARVLPMCFTVQTMHIEIGDLEGSAEALYSLAGCGRDEVLKPSQIARRILGGHAVRSVPGLLEHAHLSRLYGEPIIAVRASLSKAEAQHAIGHELGHWILEREGCFTGNMTELENACDFIGAAIQLRRGPFKSRAQVVGFAPARLAAEFGVSETCAALRIGETRGVPMVVVSPLTVRARGLKIWQWPDTQTIRHWARRGAPGLRKVVFSDDRERVALVAKDAA